MKTLITKGKVIDPSNQFHQVADILIENGKVTRIAKSISDEDAEVIDASGCIVTPGLIDIHVHFRDPGFPEKETITSGTRAAAAGGFTAVVCMPNTKPAIDTEETLRYVTDTAKKDGVIRLYSSAAMTYGIKGEAITDLDKLYRAGAVTFTDDGRSVMDPNILYQAFEKAAALNIPISSHCEDHHLVREGAINRGQVSKKMGDVGIPRLAEELVVARDILFAEETGARLHIQHVSTARAVQLIRKAKLRGVRVTGEAAPHHFTLTDDIVLEVGAMAKVNPPIRTEQDVEAVIKGIQDGTLEAIATDHAPHTLVEKYTSLSEAPFGLIGLETSVGLTFTRLVHSGKISVDQAIALMTIQPANIMGLPGGKLAMGEAADLTIIDPDCEWTVDPGQFYSKSQNTPFTGMTLKGKVMMTMVDGQVVHEDEAFKRQK